jgi:poly-D-alanine transfer protein DltD
MKIKKFNEKEDNEHIKNLIKGLKKDEDKTNSDNKIISNFDKFEEVKEKLISKINSERIIGNTLSDLGNFIGQTIYEFIDEDNTSFSSDDFIGGFEHGIDSMKEPSKSKWHNFE